MILCLLACLWPDMPVCVWMCVCIIDENDLKKVAPFRPIKKNSRFWIRQYNYWGLKNGLIKPTTNHILYSLHASFVLSHFHIHWERNVYYFFLDVCASCLFGCFDVRSKHLLFSLFNIFYLCCCCTEANWALLFFDTNFTCSEYFLWFLILFFLFFLLFFHSIIIIINNNDKHCSWSPELYASRASV